MALTQESVLSLLIAEGGKVKKSDLVRKFRGSVECVDPTERERNRELFKTFVNNVAFVREVDGVRCVVLKKVYQHLLATENPVEENESEEMTRIGEPQRQPAWTENSEGARGERSAAPEPAQDEEAGENPAELLSPIQLALQRSKYSEIRIRRSLGFKQDAACSQKSSNNSTSIQNKPYALPLRMPPSSTVLQIQKLKADPGDRPAGPDYSKRPHSVETGNSVSSPQLRRTVKSTKVTEEPKDSRMPSAVPLEPSEHEWLVKCAAGRWSQVYGLLLRDNRLAEKRDFMSGFTALHWVAKWGNSEMLVKIIDVSKHAGVGVDINVKAHGGYTPLHIAALHDQGYIMTMLVQEYGANVRIRDNCGKRAYHYLHKGISGAVREMLGEPRTTPGPPGQDRHLHEKEELDLFPDLSKSLHSISRLFQPNITGHKKKHKQRSGLYYVSDEAGEEREDSSFRHRAGSDIFM